MTETKPTDSNPVPEADHPQAPPAAAAFDPGQTRLLPPKTVLEKQDAGRGPGLRPGAAPGMVAAVKPWRAVLDWFKNLSQASIIWISFSIILVFLVVLILLIVQSGQKSKLFKSAATEPIAAAGENHGSVMGGLSPSYSSRQTGKSVHVLTDDEFAGTAPMVVRANGPVFSAAIDPELAALADALKKRSQMSADSGTVPRGNSAARVSKGEFRGFKVSVEEKIENREIRSEEVTVTMPRKGLIKTVNRVLESVREIDLDGLVSELQHAGLEVVTLPVEAKSNVLRVQLRAVGIFGKPVEAELLLSGKSVGKIFLGMPTARLENMLFSSYVVLKRKVLVNEIYHDVYKVLDQSNEPLFFVYENKGRIWGIAIISEIFKTDKGIGIGSSLGSIRVNYPRVSLGVSDKKIPYVKVDGVDGLFVIQSDGVNVAKRIFPNQTKVVSIMIGNSLEFE